MTTAVVLLSGGVDSTTCLSLAVATHGAENILALSFEYQQKHSQELLHAREVCEHFSVEQRVIHLPDIFKGSKSTLVEGGPDNPTGTYAELPAGPSPTYVPFRNGNLLANATTIATVEEAEEVWFGAHADDASRWAYPDCTFEFLGAMANAIWVGTYHKTRLVAPLVWLTKKDVVALGLRYNAPFHLTRSCYNAGEYSCGKCPTCLDRQEAFRANGMDDPIKYAVEV